MPVRIFIWLFFQLIVFAMPSFSQDSLRLVAKISIEGNKKTHRHIIERELQLKVGDTLKTSDLNRILEADRRKIINTNLFITVEIASKLLENQAIEVLVKVKERLYFVGLPVLYLADRNFNEWWYERNRDWRRTIYGVMLRHYNLTGNNDQLRIRAEFGFVPNFEFSYGRPYVDKALKTGVWGGVLYATNKAVAYRTWNDKLQFVESTNKQRERWNYYLSLTRRTGFYQTQRLDFSYNRAVISDTVAILNPSYFRNGDTRQKYFSIDYFYQYDRRDNQQYSLSGYRFFVVATQTGIFRKDDIKQFSLLAGSYFYKPFSKKFYGSIGLKAKVSFPKNQPYLQNIGLGFRNDLVRGYELYVIDAQQYGLVKTNLKYKLFDKVFDLSKFIKVKQLNTLPVSSYLNTFLDLGYAQNQFPERSNTRLANTLLIGTGVGADVVTWYNIVGRITYSVNKMNERRLFFNITREF